MKMQKSSWLFLVICFHVIILFSNLVCAEGTSVGPPSAEGIVKSLNEDPYLSNVMGFVFEQDGIVLWFHTGKSAVEISGDWMSYCGLVRMISNRWKAVTGCGIVVGIDSEAMIVFAIDSRGTFHMNATPEKHKDRKANEHKNPRVLITF
jgi:hypothetical protein